MLRTIAIAGLLTLAGLGLARAASDPDYKTPAKTLFGAVKEPSDDTPHPIGFYAKGCLSGAVPLPLDGPSWQVMRLSRNRNWGMPQLAEYLEKFSADARKYDGWPGLLIGDMSQPRGGPMATGHASHQIGLDVDIWYVPMPDHTLTANERETIPAVSLLMTGRLSVDPQKWSDRFPKLLKRAASYPEVTRIFVSPAIKQELCNTATGDREWLRKLRPWFGHDDHFHVRLACPAGFTACEVQAPPPPGDGCGADLAWWFQPHPPPPKPVKPVPPPKPKPPLTLAGLPKECTDVLYAKDKLEAPVALGADPAGKPVGRDPVKATVGK